MIALLNLNAQLETKYVFQQKKRGEQIVATNNMNEKYREEKKRYRNTKKLIKKAIRGKKYEKYAHLLGLNESKRLINRIFTSSFCYVILSLTFE
jgi:hypothetical protein